MLSLISMLAAVCYILTIVPGAMLNICVCCLITCSQHSCKAGTIFVTFTHEQNKAEICSGLPRASQLSSDNTEVQIRHVWLWAITPNCSGLWLSRPTWIRGQGHTSPLAWFTEKNTRIRGEEYVVQGHRADYQNPEPLISRLLSFLLLPEPSVALSLFMVSRL